MSAAKKMNEKERKISSELIKKLNQLMSKHDIKSDAECMRKIQETTGFIFNQSKFSDIKNGKTFPTTLELIAFSDFFEVSIDHLLGREQSLEAFSVYEICENLARLFISDVNIEFTTENKKYGAIENIGFNFDESTLPPFPLEPAQQNVNSFLINEFIKTVKPIADIARNDSITKEIYNSIISGILDKMVQRKTALENEIQRDVTEFSKQSLNIPEDDEFYESPFPPEY